MEGRQYCLQKVLTLRVVLGHLCTGKRKLLDSFEQASEIKCPMLFTNTRMIQKLSLLAVHLTVLKELKAKMMKYQLALLFIQVKTVSSL